MALCRVVRAELDVIPALADRRLDVIPALVDRRLDVTVKWLVSKGRSQQAAWTIVERQVAKKGVEPVVARVALYFALNLVHNLYSKYFYLGLIYHSKDSA